MSESSAPKINIHSLAKDCNPRYYPMPIYKG
jgi:hypothetical protein